MSVLLVDGSNLARRNFHAQNLNTSTGIRTGLVYGVINSLLSLQEKLKATETVVVWDAENSTERRRAIMPMYKAGRNTEGREQYEEDKELCMQLLEALGVCQVSKEGTECDDIIGYLTLEKYRDDDVVILSNDKDFYQLISKRVSVVKPDLVYIVPDPTGKIHFKDGTKMVAIRPDQIISYKSLVGDASDNIPGAPGFGVGAALTFFANNDSVKQFIDGKANLNGLTTKALQGLAMVIPVIEKYVRLVTINPEWGKVELPPRPEPNRRLVEGLLEHLEFKQFASMGERLYTVGGR